MSILKNIILLGFISLLMTACGDNADENTKKDEAKGDHIWKSQTDTLQSAKDSVKKMQDTIKQQQESMDENK